MSADTWCFHNRIACVPDKRGECHADDTHRMCHSPVFLLFFFLWPTFARDSLLPTPSKLCRHFGSIAVPFFLKKVATVVPRVTLSHKPDQKWQQQACYVVAVTQSWKVVACFNLHFLARVDCLTDGHRRMLPCGASCVAEDASKWCPLVCSLFALWRSRHSL